MIDHDNQVHSVQFESLCGKMHILHLDMLNKLKHKQTWLNCFMKFYWASSYEIGSLIHVTSNNGLELSFVLL